MRPVRNFAVLLTLVACSLSVPLRSDGQSPDLPETTPFASLGAGTAVNVNVDIILPANQGTLYFQNGAFVQWEAIDKAAPSCRLSAGDSPTVRKLVPGRKLIVTGTRFGSGVANLYGDTLLFDDDATIAQLQCMSPRKGFMTIGDLKKIFGGLFSLIQAEPVVG